MATNCQIRGIILAAGLSSRMGVGINKLLLTFAGRPLFFRPIFSVAAVGKKLIDTVEIVYSDKRLVEVAADSLPPVIYRRCRWLNNPDAASGLSSSLKTGLRQLTGCESALVLLADQPFVTAAVISRLINCAERNPGRAVRPVNRTGPCHPVLIPYALSRQLLDLRGDKGAAALLNKSGNKPLLLPQNDRRLNFDIDTAADYQQAIKIEKAEADCRKKNKKKL